MSEGDDAGLDCGDEADCSRPDAEPLAWGREGDLAETAEEEAAGCCWPLTRARLSEDREEDREGLDGLEEDGSSGESVSIMLERSGEAEEAEYGAGTSRRKDVMVSEVSSTRHDGRERKSMWRVLHAAKCQGKETGSGWWLRWWVVMTAYWSTVKVLVQPTAALRAAFV
jgi:hypothetical protein